MKNIKIIGLGGIGGWLVDPLVLHLVNNPKEQYQLTLIDGDTFEDKNLNRQRFNRMGNKAEVVSERLRQDYGTPNLQFNCRKDYINDTNVVRHIREDDIVFLCVDNHATRKIVSDRCEELNNVTLISGGNELEDGNVIYYSRVDKNMSTGKEIGKAPTKLFKEIANPTDEVPGVVREGSCETQVASAPQLVFTNNMAAATMLNVFYAHEQNKHAIEFDQVYFDIRKVSTRKSPEQVETLDFEE